jgi:hypothetical protein
MFLRNKKDSLFNPVAEYALTDRKPQPFKEGDNLNGQVALNKTMTILYDVPENYFLISSGLGSSQPHYLILAPVVVNENTIAVLEMASFKKPDENTGKMLERIFNEVGNKLNKFITD